MEDNGGGLTVSNKRVILEDLSKEDLIKRCKNYLILAQKAKSARDGTYKSNYKCIVMVVKNISIILDSSTRQFLNKYLPTDK